MFIFSLCFSLPLLLEIVVGLLSPFCTGMFRPQHALRDSQGTLVERLRLLILALLVVEDGQVLQGACRRGVLAEQALTDSQGPLVERLGLLILALVLIEAGQVLQDA